MLNGRLYTFSEIALSVLDSPKVSSWTLQTEATVSSRSVHFLSAFSNLSVPPSVTAVREQILWMLLDLFMESPNAAERVQGGCENQWRCPAQGEYFSEKPCKAIFHCYNLQKHVKCLCSLSALSNVKHFSVMTNSELCGGYQQYQNTIGNFGMHDQGFFKKIC